MADWLPQDWEVKDLEGKAARAIQGVRKREARRRRVARTSGIAAGFAVALLSLYVLPGLFQTSTGDAASMARLQPPAPAPASADASLSASSAPIPNPKSQFPNPQSPIPNSQSQIPNSLSPLPVSNSQIRNPKSQMPSPPPTPRLSKAPAGVELTWQGDPQGEYVVYRCTRPTFDTCASAGVVRGTRWTDPEMNDSPVVFYKIEPKA